MRVDGHAHAQLHDHGYVHAHAGCFGVPHAHAGCQMLYLLARHACCHLLHCDALWIHAPAAAAWLYAAVAAALQGPVAEPLAAPH